jgi:hypothetical protein
MMNEFVSWAFLKSLMKMAYRKGSMHFLKVSHISAKVIIPFLARVDLRDSTNFSTSGIMIPKFC